MFAIDYPYMDYPYMDSKESAQLMQKGASAAGRYGKITHGNAEKIFHISTV